MNFSGQPEEMNQVAAIEEEERILIVTDAETNVDTISGENQIIQYSNVDDYYYFLGQSGSGNNKPSKTKLSKASQEAVLRRHLRLENEKKKNNSYIW